MQTPLEVIDMTNATATSFLDVVNNRHAVKKFDPSFMLIAIGIAETPARASLRFPTSDTVVWNEF